VAPAPPPAASVTPRDDEPRAWIDRLEDPKQRQSAVEHLLSMARDDASGASALFDAIVEPLTKAYVAGGLDARARVELIRFLAESRDVRSKAAWMKACTGFAEGTGPTEDDVRWAAPAIASAKLDEAVPDLGRAYWKLEAGTQRGAGAYKAVHDAMLELKSPIWWDMLVERLGRPVVKPLRANDGSRVTAYQNEIFWQTTAAEILGEFHHEAAVEPLFKVVVDPTKSDIAGFASVALMKIGRKAVPPLLDVLSGSDTEMVEYAKTVSVGRPDAETSHVRAAAIVLGAIGRAEAVAPLLRALASTKSDTTRAVIARELTKFARTPELEKGFMAAFEKVSPTTVMLPWEQPARPELLEAAAHLYDPGLVPWLLKQIQTARGSDDQKAAVKAAALVSAIRLMNKGDVGRVQSALERAGTPIERNEFELAKGVVDECGENVDCYVSKLVDPAALADKPQFAGIKAGYMLAILGKADTSRAILKVFPAIRNAAVRYIAVSAIDHLTQTDPLPVANALQAIIDEDRAKNDRNMMAADAPVRQIVYRLRAR
jgi:hypothetical protein